MATIESPEKVGLKPFHEFDRAQETWPRGDRPAAIREAASEFRARFAVPENRIQGVRTVDIASAGYPVRFAFGGAAKGVNPFINILNRLVVIQYEDFEGDLRTLVYEPTVTEGPTEAPFYDQLLRRYGEFLSYKVFATFYNDVPQAMAKAGVRLEDVDFISFDHLHVQDVRFVLGSTEPPPGHESPAAAAVPEREADHPAPRVGHLPLDPPDAVGLVRRRTGRGGPGGEGRPRRRRRGARQGHRAGLDPRPHRRQPLPLHQHRGRSLGVDRRTASPPTTGTPTSRRSPGSARRPSSSAAR